MAKGYTTYGDRNRLDQKDISFVLDPADMHDAIKKLRLCAMDLRKEMEYYKLGHLIMNVNAMIGIADYLAEQMESGE